MALLLEGGVPMKRFMVFLALIALSVPVSMNLAVGEEPAALSLEKECILFGRILGSHVLLYPARHISAPVYELPEMTQIQGFEVLNVATGEWHQISLSEDGYFCANVGMGRYDLRGRDADGEAYVIYSFTIPRGMGANLGEFWIEVRDPDIVALEGWFSYIKAEGWQEYKVDSGRIAMRVQHATSDQAYNECEDWFAGCHQEAFDKFAQVIARR